MHFCLLLIILLYIHFRGYKRFFRRAAVETSDYLKDDCLVMKCTVGVVRTHLDGPKQFVIPVPPSDMGRGLKDLLSSGVGCDIVFHVGDESYKAHKLILAARSPVFRAQFFGLVGDPSVDKVVVKDVEPFIFKVSIFFSTYCLILFAFEWKEKIQECPLISISISSFLTILYNVKLIMLPCVFDVGPTVCNSLVNANMKIGVTYLEHVYLACLISSFNVFCFPRRCFCLFTVTSFLMCMRLWAHRLCAHSLLWCSISWLLLTCIILIDLNCYVNQNCVKKSILILLQPHLPWLSNIIVHSSRLCV